MRDNHMSRREQRFALGWVFTASFLAASGLAWLLHIVCPAPVGWLLAASVLLVAVNALLHFLLPESPRASIWGILLSTIAAALAIAACLNHLGTTFHPAALCLEVAALALTALLVRVMSRDCPVRLRPLLILLLLTAVAAVYLLWFAIRQPGNIPFGLVFIAFILIAAFWLLNGEETGLGAVLKAARLISYGVWAAVFLIALVVVSGECDCDCDCCDCDRSKPKKSRPGRPGTL